MMNHLKATDFVAEWVAAHRCEIGGTELQVIRGEEHGRTYYSAFKTSKYLIEFRAWDYGNCLDIIASGIESPDDDLAYTVSGPCDGVAGMSARLSSFLRWLSVNDPTRNT